MTSFRESELLNSLLRTPPPGNFTCNLHTEAAGIGHSTLGLEGDDVGTEMGVVTLVGMTKLVVGFDEPTVEVSWLAVGVIELVGVAKVVGVDTSTVGVSEVSGDTVDVVDKSILGASCEGPHLSSRTLSPSKDIMFITDFQLS